MWGRMRSEQVAWGFGASVAGSTLHSDENLVEGLVCLGNPAFSGARRRCLWGTHRPLQQGRWLRGPGRPGAQVAPLFLVSVCRI